MYAEPGRLRAGWRLLLFGGSLMLFYPIAESFIAPAFAALSRAMGEPVAAYAWIMLAAVWCAVLLALKVVDRGEWAAIGLGDGAWRIDRLSGGLALGIAAIVLTSLMLWAGGWLRIEQIAPLGTIDGAVAVESSWGASALRWLVLLAPAALWEELLFRGYLWTVVEDAGGANAGSTAALVITSVLFGLVHLQNPGAGVRTTILVTLAGLCLGLLRARMASLPAAWMAHLGWNWTMAAVLHVPVSGLPVASSGYRAVITGPVWLTGGEWGPEGGAVAAITLGGALCIALRRELRGEWRDMKRFTTYKRNGA